MDRRFLQVNAEAQMIVTQNIEDLPLEDAANIVNGNALDVDGNEVLPAGERSELHYR